MPEMTDQKVMEYLAGLEKDDKPLLPMLWQDCPDIEMVVHNNVNLVCHTCMTHRYEHGAWCQECRGSGKVLREPTLDLAMECARHLWPGGVTLTIDLVDESKYQKVVLNYQDGPGEWKRLVARDYPKGQEAPALFRLIAEALAKDRG